MLQLLVPPRSHQLNSCIIYNNDNNANYDIDNNNININNNKINNINNNNININNNKINNINNNNINNNNNGKSFIFVGFNFYSVLGKSLFRHSGKSVSKFEGDFLD